MAAYLRARAKRGQGTQSGPADDDSCGEVVYFNNMTSVASGKHPKTGITLPLEVVADFCRRWGVDEFALFGSVLRDDFRPDSDVDVLVTFAPDTAPTLYDLVDMQDELEATFGRPVDLLTRKGIERMQNSLRRREILESARVFYAR